MPLARRRPRQHTKRFCSIACWATPCFSPATILLILPGKCSPLCSTAGRKMARKVSPFTKQARGVRPRLTLSLSGMGANGRICSAAWIRSMPALCPTRQKFLCPMSMPEIRVFQNLEELSQAAAARFAEITAQPRSDNRPFSIALSGGHTPKHLYELLATQEFSSRIPWSNVHLFQVDERCVPPTGTESNYRMIREAMLDEIPLPSGHFHRRTTRS